MSTIFNSGTWFRPFVAAFVLATNVVQAQSDALGHVEAMFKAISAARTYRVTAQVTERNTADGKAVTSFEARSYRDGDQFLSEIGPNTSLSTKGYFVLVDRVEKLIVVRQKTGRAPTVKDPMTQWSEMMAAGKGEAERWSMRPARDGQVELLYKPANGPYRNLVVTLRSSDHLPVKVTYDLVERTDIGFDRVELVYTEMEVDCAIDASVFSLDRFVKKNGQGAYVPAREFHDHRIEYLPAS